MKRTWDRILSIPGQMINIKVLKEAEALGSLPFSPHQFIQDSRQDSDNHQGYEHPQDPHPKSILPEPQGHRDTNPDHQHHSSESQLKALKTSTLEPLTQAQPPSLSFLIKASSSFLLESNPRRSLYALSLRYRPDLFPRIPEWNTPSTLNISTSSPQIWIQLRGSTSLTSSIHGIGSGGGDARATLRLLSTPSSHTSQGAKQTGLTSKRVILLTPLSLIV